MTGSGRVGLDATGLLVASLGHPSACRRRTRRMIPQGSRPGSHDLCLAGLRAASALPQVGAAREDTGLAVLLPPRESVADSGRHVVELVLPDLPRHDQGAADDRVPGAPAIGPARPAAPDWEGLRGYRSRACAPSSPPGRVARRSSGCRVRARIEPHPVHLGPLGAQRDLESVPARLVAVQRGRSRRPARDASPSPPGRRVLEGARSPSLDRTPSIREVLTRGTSTFALINERSTFAPGCRGSPDRQHHRPQFRDVRARDDRRAERDVWGVVVAPVYAGA